MGEGEGEVDAVGVPWADIVGDAGCGSLRMGSGMADATVAPLFEVCRPGAAD
jgi:hypothetical protein